VLMSLQKHEQALPHLQKAIGLNPENDVSCYWLSQVQGILANTVEQKRAFAEFERLHERTFQPARMREQAQPSEVTKQALEPSVEP